MDLWAHLACCFRNQSLRYRRTRHCRRVELPVREVLRAVRTSVFSWKGWCFLLSWCDMRIAEDDAVLGVFCRRFGVPLIDGGTHRSLNHVRHLSSYRSCTHAGTVRLPATIGLGRAMDLILTGRAVGAHEALAMGLVSRVVPKGQALPAALELAHRLVALPQQCMRNDRLSTYAAVYDGSGGLQRRLETEFDFELRSMAAAEFVSGPRAFLQGAGRHGDVATAAAATATVSGHTSDSSAPGAGHTSADWDASSGQRLHAQARL